MDILFLTQVLPYPLDAGPKVRAYYVLRCLAQSHTITLVSFVRPTDTPAAVEHLKQFCQAVHTLPMPRSRVRDAVHLLKSLVTGQSFIIARDWVPAMMAMIRDQLATTDFDIIHADQLWMAKYALRARNSQVASRNLKLVLDQHNAVYKVPARLAEGEQNRLKQALLTSEAHKLARYEMEICQQFDQVVWVTHQDFEAMQQQVPGSGFGVPKPTIIPICGDPGATAVVDRKVDARRVTFLGGLHWPPNAQGVIWFAQQIFPQVLTRVPDAVLTVIGKDPPRELQNTRSPIRKSNLEVTGYVADPRPYLEETALFVVPLLAGGGMRVKIIDAWMWGLPVISTTIGAEGIETRPGENILITDTPQAFAEVVVYLLQHPAKAQKVAQAGRGWVEQHYNWHTVYRLWDQVYARLEATG